LKKLLVSLSVALALAVLPVSAKSLTNVDPGGLALQGYDPVAFFDGGKPVAGLPSITATHEGATYRFATTDHKTAFEKEPAKYVPAFGGYCAFGVAYGGLYPVTIETWQILHGRLVLNKTPEVRAMFDKDKEGNLTKADANWPGLLDKSGR